jgi:hypothetical protein
MLNVLPVLPLLLSLQLPLQIIDLSNKLRLVHLVVLRVLLHVCSSDDDILLKLHSHLLGI